MKTRFLILIAILILTKWANAHTLYIVGRDPSFYSITMPILETPDGIEPLHFSNDYGIDNNSDWVYYGDDDTCYRLPETNVWPAILAGMGVGFQWLGFLWVMRITRRTGIAEY